MCVREATLQDLPDMRRVRLAVTENPIDEEGLTSLGITPESVAHLLRTVGKAWVAEYDGNVIGFSVANEETASIWAVFILPEYEGRGFGRRLMERAVEWIWNRDLEEIWLSTNRDSRSRAHGFYRKLGWEQDGELPNGEVRYVLRRPTSNSRSSGSSGTNAAGPPSALRPQ